jgi:hypothetical protein
VCRKDFTRKQRGRPLDFFVDQFQTKYEERTSQDNQRGRPHDIVVIQFETKYEERTSHDNQGGRPLDFFVDHFLTKCEERTSQENKEEGLLISLSTSSKPSMKKGLHKKIKEEPS